MKQTRWRDVKPVLNDNIPLLRGPRRTGCQISVLFQMGARSNSGGSHFRGLIESRSRGGRVARNAALSAAESIMERFRSIQAVNLDRDRPPDR